MNTATSYTGPSRFSRMTFNLGFKSQSEPHSRTSNTRRKQHDEGWYIPYTGTYESPPEPQTSGNRDRDSWGDPIPGLNGVEASGNGLHVHYNDDTGNVHELRLSEENRARGGHVQLSNYTASTGLDHGRVEQGTKRQYYANSHHLSTPSYVNPDVVSVGESPHFPLPKERTLSHRSSLASTFTFGIRPFSSVDRILRSPSCKRSPRPNSTSVDMTSNRLSPVDHCRTISGDCNSHPMCVKRGVMNPSQIVKSQTTADEDYYHSYYSTLLQSPAKPRTPISVNPISSSESKLTTISQHPYAIAFPSTEDKDSAQKIPTLLSSVLPAPQTHRPPLVVSNLTSSPSHFSTSEHVAPNDFPQRQIKASTSTPNLKSTKNQSRNVPRGIDRWLSAETWCDALFFPRPRLKIKNEKSNSGRIVSPPASPVLPTGGGDRMTSVPSRVLAHSMSLVNLRKRTREHRRQQQFQGGPPLSSPTASQVQLQLEGVNDKKEQPSVDNSARPFRPKSWALDDLDLPSSVPSLAKVLAEGERLDSDRKQWRTKAEGSWGYKRARSVSRSRSKSLTANGRKKPSEVPSHIDFLTARAVHGNQGIIPAFRSTPKHERGLSSSGSHSQGTSDGHTQMSSLIRSWTHSSRSPCGHSRNGSWSNSSAIKTVAHTASMPVAENNSYQGPQARVLLQGSSLTPPSTSGDSDPLVGIAISVPFIDDSLDRENFQLGSHPYAQGGLYSFTPSSPVREKRAKYAGPHPIQNVQPQEIPASPAARHRLPPQVILSHPYARATSPIRDSYDDGSIPNTRPDSDVPSPAKVWTPLALGIVHDMLPGDLRDSSLISPDANLKGDMAMSMNMTGIVDTVGVGKALAFASEYQGEKQGRESIRDSGLGTSENVYSGGSVPSVAQLEEQLIARVCSPSRMPVQYDITRPSYRPQRKTPWTPETLDTLASSPLEHQYTPRMPEFIQTAKADLASSVLISPENSFRRHSPRALGNLNDLAGSQDLSYRPRNTTKREPQEMASFCEHNLDGLPVQPSNIHLKSRQWPTSSLASLAGKLSQGYEQISTKERAESQTSRYTSSLVTGLSRSPTARLPKDPSLEFVFEQPPQGPLINGHGQTGSSLPFEPQENVPEDVHSMSSIETGRELEATESEDETEVFHVKQVEVATPAEVDTDHRSSYAGQLGCHNERPEVDGPLDTTPTDYDFEVSSRTSSSPRILSDLLSPLSDNARSSSYTTSTMSGLSDFPVPPANNRMSVFLNEVTGQPPFFEEDRTSEPTSS